MFELPPPRFFQIETRYIGTNLAFFKADLSVKIDENGGSTDIYPALVVFKKTISLQRNGKLLDVRWWCIYLLRFGPDKMGEILYNFFKVISECWKKLHFRSLESDRFPCYKGAWICQVPSWIYYRFQTDFFFKKWKRQIYGLSIYFGVSYRKTSCNQTTTMKIHILLWRWQLTIDWWLCFLTFSLCCASIY